MAEFLTDEWFDVVATAGAELDKLPGVCFTFTVEVSESPLGKVRGHGEIADGQLVAFATGKPPAAADVAFSAKTKRFMPILDGTQHPLVAFMMGELKVEGDYERVVDDFASQVDPTQFEAFRKTVHDATD